jgi:hypothetical protein
VYTLVQRDLVTDTKSVAKIMKSNNLGAVIGVPLNQEEAVA